MSDSSWFQRPLPGRGRVLRRALLAAVALPALAAPAAGAASDFANPRNEDRPMSRYWLPSAAADHTRIADEIHQVADAGWGGVEVINMMRDGSDPAQYGWGTPAWNEAMRTIMRTARQRDLQVDLTIGPVWPAAVPGVTPDDPLAAQELAAGRAVVAGGAGYDALLPRSDRPARAGVADERLVAVQALRCATDCEQAAPVVLERDSLIDLTDEVDGSGRLTWTAPAGGEWIVLAYWERGTGQTPNDRATIPAPYVIDHFSADATQALVDYWNANLLPQDVRDLIAQVGGSMFEDSLELRTNRHWTPEMFDEFRQRVGYDLRPFLPIVAGNDERVGHSGGHESIEFEYEDAGLGARVRHDYDQVLNDLYLDNHIRPLQSWANGIGLRYRAQPYGSAQDSIEAGQVLDVVEGEGQDFGIDGYDSWRSLAGGAHIAGKNLVSDECCAIGGTAYGVTWGELMLQNINNHYAAGMNHVVFHGFAHGEIAGGAWPGWSPFGYSFGEPFGTRQPAWGHMPALAEYFGRTQSVLRAGKPRIDLAIFRQSWDHDGGELFFREESVGRAGYTYEFLAPSSFEEPLAVVEDGRLAPGGPAYKALVLVDQETLPLETARKLLEHARDGLPIHFVGELPSSVPGFRDAARQDDALRDLMERILAQPSVRHLGDAAELVAALTADGVHADARQSTPSDVMSVHRAVDGRDLYWLYNTGTEPVEQTISFAGAGAPYALDPWSGSVEPIGVHRAVDGRVEVPVELAPGEATIVELRGGAAAPLTVVSTEADEARVAGGEVTVRATRGGTFASTLSDGTTVSATVGDVPAPRTLGGWDLQIEDWRPGPEQTTTSKTIHQLSLPALAPWLELPGFEDVSGIGRYTTTVTLDDRSASALLRLGEVTDTFTVTINGRRLPGIDQGADVAVDVAPYLRAGANTIEVVVATTLLNRMRAELPASFARRRAQRYGLVGPVQLIPYGEATVDATAPRPPVDPPRPPVVDPPRPPVVDPPRPPVADPPAGDTAEPRLSKVGPAARTVRRGRAATLRFTLSERARVRVVVERRVSGRKRGSVCATGRRAPARGARCDVWKQVRATTVTGAPGANRVTLLGRARTRRLAAGAYRVTLRATDAAGNRSGVVRTRLTLVR